jgi:hypothetical protein
MLRIVASSARPDEESSPFGSLVRDVAMTIAQFAPGTPAASYPQPPLHEASLGDESLALPLGLSLVMRRHDAGPRDVADACLYARRLILEWAALDQSSEPVPLPAGEDRLLVLNLAGYLSDLIDRASRARRTTRSAAVAAAVDDGAREDPRFHRRSRSQ